MDDLSNLRYCLTCGKKDLTYRDIYTGTRYHITSSKYYDFEVGLTEECPEQCFGPFATCPPPISDGDYWTWLFSQPIEEETDPIEILWADLVGVE